MKKALCLFLVLLLLLSLCACGGKDAIDPVLAQRRDVAESYMRAMTTVLWSPEEDILYTLVDKKTPENSPKDKQMLLKAGRIYRGMPIAYAGSTLATFLEYTKPSEQEGVLTISQLPWRALSGSSNYSRVGIDSSSVIGLAWSQAGSTVRLESTKNMTPKNGFLHVGTYNSDNDTNSETNKICSKNGQEVMFAAYAQLLKADALVTVLESGGHAMMVTDVHVSSKKGVINGDESYVTVLAQSTENFRSEVHYHDEKLGEDVYVIADVDIRYSFNELYHAGYLPMTCQELIDPSPVAEARVSDSNEKPLIENFLQGFLVANYNIDTITVTIFDMDDNILQQAALRAARYDKSKIGINNFVEENADRIRGSVDYTQLPTGTYRCTLVCRLVNGQEFTTRDITFDIE